MEENLDFVRYASYDTSWIFSIKGRAQWLSDEFQEIIDLTKNIFLFTKEFYLPTKIWYNFMSCSRNHPVNDIILYKVMPSEAYEREIVNETGISYNDFIYSIYDIKTKYDNKYIHNINFMRGKTRFVLRGRNEFIDANSEGLFVLIEDDEKSVPICDPLRIQIAHSRAKDKRSEVNIYDPAYYQIKFSTETDIWFENTDIGNSNRDSLRKVFQKIRDNYEVVDTEFFGLASALNNY